MSYKPRYDSGSWNVICDACGRKFQADQLQMRWDGLMVCSGDWETRQPQDFVHGVADKIAPPFARPESSDYFIPIQYSDQEYESVPVEELVAKGVVKVVGGKTLILKSALNGEVLNGVGLNATVSDPPIDYEAVAITESIFVGVGRAFAETVSPTESLTKQVIKALSDSIPVAESLQFIETETTVESLSVSESVRRSVARVVAETISLAETYSKSVGKQNSEAISIGESLAKSFGKQISESISIAETSRFNVSKGISETVSIAEAVSTLMQSPTVLNGSALNSFGLD